MGNLTAFKKGFLRYLKCCSLWPFKDNAQPLEKAKKLSELQRLAPGVEWYP